MKKRVFAVIICIALALTAAASAAELRAGRVQPRLSFSGTTAYCSISIYEAGEPIKVTLELWRGKSYHLEANGTIGDTLFSAVSKTSTCQ